MPSQECVFCKIIQGSFKAHVVYEDEKVMAFMDRRQANPGNFLVVSKEHIEDIYALPPDVGAAIMESLIRIARAVKAVSHCEGLSIWQNNGKAAGQEAPHIHFRIQTRKLDDGLIRLYPSKPPYPTDEELQAYAQQIRQELEGR
ncbi:MAG: HIT family protein [Chloroflexota bacterium]